jgi:hypothetical protein
LGLSQLITRIITSVVLESLKPKVKRCTTERAFPKEMTLGLVVGMAGKEVHFSDTRM